MGAGGEGGRSPGTPPTQQLLILRRSRATSGTEGRRRRGRHRAIDRTHWGPPAVPQTCPQRTQAPPVRLQPLLVCESRAAETPPGFLEQPHHQTCHELAVHSQARMGHVTPGKPLDWLKHRGPWEEEASWEDGPLKTLDQSPAHPRPGSENPFLWAAAALPLLGNTPAEGVCLSCAPHVSTWSKKPHLPSVPRHNTGGESEAAGCWALMAR